MVLSRNLNVKLYYLPASWHLFRNSINILLNHAIVILYLTISSSVIITNLSNHLNSLIAQR